MAEHMPGLPRPRTFAHPGPFSSIRIEHMLAAQGRHFRLSLPQGRSIYEAMVEALAGVNVRSASMTLIDGDLQELAYCLAGPGTRGIVATYSAPLFERSARFIFGNATLGKAADGSPVVHCHAVFRTPGGAVRGGHLLTDKCVVGASPIKVVATALDGFDLRISYDEETRMPLLRPNAEGEHA